jgi:hypothetical protein
MEYPYRKLSGGCARLYNLSVGMNPGQERVIPVEVGIDISFREIVSG